MLQTIKDFIFSSTGEGISLRLKSLIGIIVLGAGLFHFGVNTAELGDIFDRLGAAVTAIGTLISVVTYIRGHSRNVFYKQNAMGRYDENSG